MGKSISDAESLIITTHVNKYHRDSYLPPSWLAPFTTCPTCHLVQKNAATRHACLGERDARPKNSPCAAGYPKPTSAHQGTAAELERAKSLAVESGAYIHKRPSATRLRDTAPPPPTQHSNSTPPDTTTSSPRTTQLDSPSPSQPAPEPPASASRNASVPPPTQGRKMTGNSAAKPRDGGPAAAPRTPRQRAPPPPPDVHPAADQPLDAAVPPQVWHKTQRAWAVATTDILRQLTAAPPLQKPDILAKLLSHSLTSTTKRKDTPPPNGPIVNAPAAAAAAAAAANDILQAAPIPADEVIDQAPHTDAESLRVQRAARELARPCTNWTARAWRALQAVPAPELTPAAIGKLLSKYPKRDPSAAPLQQHPYDRSCVPELETDTILALIISKSPLTGHDLHGWSIGNLQCLLTTCPGALKDLTALFNDIATGVYINTSVQPLLTGLRGVALGKEGGTPGDVRPIGIGCVFVTLTATLLIRHDDTSSLIPDAIGFPHNLAHGTPGGIEAVPHIINAHLTRNPTHSCLKLDISNAFNSVCRQQVLDCAETFPTLAPLIALLYGKSTEVTFTRKTGASIIIPAEQGVTQGDPLGGLLYSTVQAKARQATLEWAAAQGKLIKITGIADDTYLLGPIQDIIDTMQQLKINLASVNLVLQVNKTQAFAPLGAHTIQAACVPHRITVADGIIAAGTPVGTDGYIDAHLQSKVADIERVLHELKETYVHGRVKLRGSLQAVIRIVRLCVAPASINFLLRTVSPRLTSVRAAQFDELIYNTVLDLLRMDRSNLFNRRTPRGHITSALIGLPASLGGLGMASAYYTREAAYAGSLALTGSLIRRHLGDDVNIISTDHADPAHPINILCELDLLISRQPIHGDPPAPSIFINVPSLASATCTDILRSRASKIQAEISAPEHAAHLARLLAPDSAISAHVTDQLRADIRSGGGEGGAAMLANAQPTLRSAKSKPYRAFDLHIEDDHFQTYLRRRAALPVIDAIHPDDRHPCTMNPKCRGYFTSRGDHTHACNEKNSDAGERGCLSRQTTRHNAVQYTVFDLLKKYAATGTRLSGNARSQPFCASFFHDPTRPRWACRDAPNRTTEDRGDIEFRRGTDSTLIDITITHPVAALVPSCAHKDGHSAQQAHKDKIQKYKENWTIPDPSGCTFVPLAMETGGRWSTETRSFWKQYLTAYVSADVDGWDAEKLRLYGAAMQTVLTAIATSLQREVAGQYIHISTRFAEHREAATQPAGGA